MKAKQLLKKLKGTQTIESVMEILNVDREKAIYYIFCIRKQGYVKTKRLSNNKRMYNISFENKLNGSNYHEIINKNSPIKITTSEIYNIYGKEPSLEETLIYSIKTQKLRIILASLSLFKKINNWVELYRLGKKNHIERQIGALYDLSRKLMKTKRMTKRFRNLSLPKKSKNSGKLVKFDYIIQDLRSKNFKDIEKTWRIYIPFNKSDLEAYQ